MENYDNGFKNGFVMGIFIDSMIFSVINVLPFTDRSKYTQAIIECEKSLSRDQHCSRVSRMVKELQIRKIILNVMIIAIGTGGSMKNEYI